MKYEALQKAADEASAGLQEVVAELDRLEARRVALLAKRESLQAVGHHLLTVMSTLCNPMAAGPSVEQEPLREAPAFEPALHTEALPEPEPVPLEEASASMEDASVGTPDAAVPDAPPTPWPSLADLLAKSKPTTLRDEGWRAVPQATHLELRALARAEG